MILKTKELKEFHENGQIEYSTIFAIIAPMWSHLYENVICFNDGTQRIRQGLTQRFWNNGQLNWQMEYSENGKLLKDSYKAFQKDGTPIFY